MLLQQEYEDLYTGPEFHLDARLAQIVAFTWVTFMYSSGLPILFLITAGNFFIIYWVDKWLLLRFYKTPKNYDQICIMFTLNEMKISFVFHFIIGAIVYSNEKILSKKGVGSSLLVPTDYDPDTDNSSIFSIQRYNSIHVFIFLTGNLIILVLAFFEHTIFSYLIGCFSCFKDY